MLEPAAAYFLSDAHLGADVLLQEPIVLREDLSTRCPALHVVFLSLDLQCP